MGNKSATWIVKISLLLCVLFISGAVSVSVGSSYIPIAKIISLIVNHVSSIEASILFDLRLPRIFLAVAVGGSLSVAGVILQGMFRNALVEPYTLGISGGAAVGVCLNIVFGIHKAAGQLSLSLFGFFGAIAVVVMVYLLSVRNGILKIQGLLLTGVMISFISSSLIMLIMAVSKTQDLHGIVFWIMGSLEEPNAVLIVWSLIVSVIGLVVSYFFAVDLNALSLGEEEAAHLGVNVEKTKRWLFVIASLLTGFSVAVAGIIGFVGLVIPHLMRMYVGTDNRILLISSFLGGAIFLMLSDTLARTIIAPVELPVGIITGLIGGSSFIYVLIQKQNFGK